MNSDKTVFIPTSIPYVNGAPHLGHALEFVYADVLSRWHRGHARNVWFSTGTDEHGQKVARKAEERGMTPQEHVDDMVVGFKNLLFALNISHDDFIQTTEERHESTAQLVWSAIQEKGDIYKDTYEGVYCVGCEAYKTEKELNENGECPIHLTAPEKLTEENYFFRLSAYSEQLAEWFDGVEGNVVPVHRKNEMREIITGGLEDVAISREKEKMSWGVAVPDDDTQVMYVWFEAVINYLSTVGYPDGELLDTAWPVDTHIIGKDINRFHSIMWPVMLLALGLELPRRIAVHGFISVDGHKMSKSLGNVIDPFDLIERYGGPDPVRYLLMREVPYMGDGDLNMERLDALYGAHLANGVGNLLSRITNMCERYFDGAVAAIPHMEGYGDEQHARYEQQVEGLEFHSALESVWSIVDDANEYIEQKKPWELAKEDMDELKVVLQHLVFAMNWIGEHLQPFMPATAEIILAAMNAERIEKSLPLFPRLEV